MLQTLLDLLEDKQSETQSDYVKKTKYGKGKVKKFIALAESNANKFHRDKCLIWDPALIKHPWCMFRFVENNFLNQFPLILPGKRPKVGWRSEKCQTLRLHCPLPQHLYHSLGCPWNGNLPRYVNLQSHRGLGYIRSIQLIPKKLQTVPLNVLPVSVATT